MHERVSLDGMGGYVKKHVVTSGIRHEMGRLQAKPSLKVRWMNAI